MEVVYIKHALDRMRERSISKRQVEEFLNNPDKLEISQEKHGRFIAKKIYFNENFNRQHLLIMVFEENDEIKKVITIIDTSKIRKYF